MGEVKVLYPRGKWRWFGAGGHFIAAGDCQFHLATHVGPWWVSTVGEYLPDSSVREILAPLRNIELEGIGDAREASWRRQNGWERIGWDRLYETMVFAVVPGSFCTTEECGCEQPEIADWSELDSDGYNTRGDAQRGHEAMCDKWSRKEVSDDEDA